MMKEIDQVDGVPCALGFHSGGGFRGSGGNPAAFRHRAAKSDQYQLFLVNSEYAVASDQVNHRITEINGILKKYDPNGMLIGEAPCKDLDPVTNHDFSVVRHYLHHFYLHNYRFGAPLRLPSGDFGGSDRVRGIHQPKDSLLYQCFPSVVAPICISTIQLGATVDYAILMTTRYKQERFQGRG